MCVCVGVGVGCVCVCVCVLVWCVVLCCVVLFLFVRGGVGWGGGGGALSFSAVLLASVSHNVACDVYYSIIPHHVLDRIISSVYNPQMQTILQKKKHFAIPSKPCVSDWYRQLMLATNRERIQP